MKITATAFLAFTALASATATPKAKTARKLANNNYQWNGGYNWNNNQGNNGQAQEGDDQDMYWQQEYQYGDDRVNNYMKNLNQYSQVRDQKYNWKYYIPQQYWDEQTDDQEREDWQRQSYGTYPKTYNFDTSWMGDYNIKFDGCAVDYDADQYGASKTELLAKFKLCPKSEANCKHGGEYVVPMSEYVSAFQNLAATDSKCVGQQEVCYSQCKATATYSYVNYGGRKLSNYQNYQNNNRDCGEEGCGNYQNKWNSGYGYGFQNYMTNRQNQYGEGEEDQNSQDAENQYYYVYNSESWGNYGQQKAEQYNEEYGYDQNEDSEEYKQAKYGYYNNLDYSAYNGGNWQNAAHNGQYDASSSGQTDDVNYEQYYEQLESSQNSESNNYYNREYAQWRQQQDGDGYWDRDIDYQNFFDVEYCRYECMNDAGMGYCNENNAASDDDGSKYANDGYNNYDEADAYNELNLAAMVDCHQIEFYSAQSKPLYVGATCKNGGVFLETFTDAACTVTASATAHQEAVGYALPETNLVEDQAMSCSGTMTFGYQDGGNWQQAQQYAGQQQQTAVSVCNALYTNSGKCEAHMDVNTKNTADCRYINHLNSNARSKWLPIGIGLVIAASLMLAAFIGYTKSTGQDVNVTVRTIQAHVTDSMKEVSSTVKDSVSAMIKSGEKALAGVHDDSATVASGDSEAAPATQYEGAELPAEKVDATVV